MNYYLFLRLGIILFTTYLLFGLVLYFYQNYLIYFPNNQDFYDCEYFEEYEKINLNGTRFYFKDNGNDVIIYYHGNAGSACDRGQFKELFEKTNKSLIFVEYAGYSNDTKRPSKKRILNDVDNVNNFINKKGFEKIYLYGESLGSGVASYHTTIANIDNIILVSPFSSLKDVAKKIYLIYPVNLLLKENYDNIKWLSNYKGNVVIFHGSDDDIVPKSFSKKLFDNLKTENKEYILIENYGHNDLWFSDKFKNNLYEYLKNN